jgi:plastocyanin
MIRRRERATGMLAARDVARATATTLLLAAAALGLAACGPTTVTPPPSLDPASPTVSASNIAFDQAELRVPADRPFTLVFHNNDGVPHNVAIETHANGSVERRFDGEVFGGPATRWYAVPALEPGTYAFVCTVHSNMTGRLVAR